MHNKTQNYNPVLVTDPHTGQIVDLKPFFDFVYNVDENNLEININLAEERLDDACKMLATNIDKETVETQFTEFTEIIRFLFNMKAAFKNLTVYKKDKN